MNKKLLFLFAALSFCMTAQATDYFVAESWGYNLTFKKTTTAPDNTSSWDATNTGEESPGWNSCTYTTVIFDSSFADARPTSCYSWFANSSVLSFIGIEYLNTSCVTNMNEMFWNCSKLTAVDVTHFDTSNVTTMQGMFGQCVELHTLDLTHFDTSNVTNMFDMFNGTKNITALDLSSFDTRKLTTTFAMFSGCTYLEYVNLSSFNTTNLTDMGHMFYGCHTLTSLDLSSFDTRNVTNMNGMFRDCYSLTSIDMTHFNTSNVTDMGEMFANCSSLTALDLSSFDCRILTNAESMFTNCTNLQTIYITDGLGNLDHDPISSQWIFTYCNSLSGGAGASYTSGGVGLTGVAGRIDTGGGGTAYFSPAIRLSDAVDNSSEITNYKDCFKAKVTLADRTLYKDNSWNTICLPFDVDLTNANSPLYGATVKELDTETGTYDHVTGFENGTLYLNFKDVTTTMIAGTPYIIKWASGDDLVNPSFLPVSISNTTNNVTSTDGKVTFTGTYAPISITSSEGDNTKLYLGSDNTLFYPNAAMTIGCQRAYFQLNGITAGEVAKTRVFLGDETSAIHNVQYTMPNETGTWYTINGMKLNGQPKRAGLYIRNGHKVVVH